GKRGQVPERLSDGRDLHLSVLRAGEGIPTLLLCDKRSDRPAAASEVLFTEVREPGTTRRPRHIYLQAVRTGEGIHPLLQSARAFDGAGSSSDLLLTRVFRRCPTHGLIHRPPRLPHSAPRRTDDSRAPTS